VSGTSHRIARSELVSAPISSVTRRIGAVDAPPLGAQASPFGVEFGKSGTLARAAGASASRALRCSAIAESAAFVRRALELRDGGVNLA
jgi:hypothetical protein